MSVLKKVSTCKGLGKKKRKKSHWSFAAGDALSQRTSATLPAQNHPSPHAQSLSLYYCPQHWNCQSRDPLLLLAKGGHLTQARPLRLLLPWGPQSDKCVLRKEVAGANLSWEPFTLCVGKLRLGVWVSRGHLNPGCLSLSTHCPAPFRYKHLLRK